MHRLLRHRILNRPAKEKIEGEFSYEKEYYPERHEEERFPKRESNFRRNANDKKYPDDRSDEYRR